MKKGFTLIELLIAMAISGIVAAGIFTTYQNQQKNYTVQESIVEMQQNLRAGMDIMSEEIRMAGCNFKGAGRIKISNIYPRNLDGTIDTTVTGNSSITIAADFNANNVLDEDETISFSMYKDPDGKQSLARDTGNGNELLAENIVAFGLAFAFDADKDEKLDTFNDHIIWAVDSDGDNKLDKNLDFTQDGIIDSADIPGGMENGLIAGQNLTCPPVSTENIKAVRIWLLARTDRKDNRYLNTHTYIVGRKIITPDQNNNHYYMRLSTLIVKCRNLIYE